MAYESQVSVFVTGVSRGLGYAIFSALVDARLRPVGIGRRFTPDQEALAEEGRCRLARCDLSDLDAVADLSVMRHVWTGSRGICFISNAGVLGPLGPVASVDRRSLRDTLAVNVEAPMLLTRNLLGAADLLGISLKIINVTSGAASKSLPGMSAYCAGKSAAMMMLDCLAAERSDVKLMHIDPGTIDTDMQASLRNTDDTVLPIAGYFRSRYDAHQLTSAGDAAADLLRTVGLI